MTTDMMQTCGVHDRENRELFSLTLQHIELHSNGALRAGGINNGLPDYSMPPCGWLN